MWRTSLGSTLKDNFPEFPAFRSRFPYLNFRWENSLVAQDGFCTACTSTATAIIVNIVSTTRSIIRNSLMFIAALLGTD